MLLTSILPAALVALGGGHAELHPESAAIYVEVPDIAAVTAAYEQAPIRTFLYSEEIRTFLASIEGEDPETFDPGVLIDRGMEELRAQLPPVGAQTLDLLGEVESFSFSVSGVEFLGLADLIAEAGNGMTEELEARIGGIQARVVLNFSSAEVAANARQLLRESAEQAPNYKRTTQEADFFGDVLEWTVHELPEIFFWEIQQDSRLILGVATTAKLEEHFAFGSLAESEAFQRSCSHSGASEGVTITEGYLSLRDLDEYARILGVIPDVPHWLPGVASMIIETVAPGGAIEVSSRTRLAGNRFVTEVFQRDFGGEDSFAGASGKVPVTADNFKMAPEDAVGAWATNIDKAILGEHLMTSLAEITGSDPILLLEALESEHGFRPDLDILDALGEDFLFYALPFSGIGMPKIFVVVELEDPEAFTRGMEGLGVFLAKQTDGALEFKSKPYRKHPFMSFAPGKELSELAQGTGAGGIVQMTPAFISISLAVGVMEDRAIFSISSMYTKREMKRLMKGDSPLHPLASGAIEIPEGVADYGHTDWGAILGGIYDSLKGLLPLIQSGIGQELPFDIENMPATELFAQHFQPTSSWSRRVDGGTYYYSASSFGPEVPAALSAVGAGVALFAARSQSIEVAPSTTVDHEVDVVGDDRSPLSLTHEALREVKIAIVVYKSEIGHYPATSNDLLAPSANFPSGFLGSEEVPKDAWGSALLYSRSEDGTSFTIWSAGPDGTDNSGTGDDVSLGN